MKDKIAVIVPVYNAEKYITECVMSIIGQTYKNLDIILVDDGSTDNSLKICEILKHKDPRIKVLSKENGGPLSAKRLGIANTEADSIIFVDSDDWIMPEMCESLYRTMTEQGVDMVASGIIRYYSEDNYKYDYNFMEAGKYKGSSYRNDVISRMLCNGMFGRRGIDASLAIKIFKKEILKPIVKRADEEYGYLFGEDTAVVYPYMLEADSVYILRECFYYHRQYENHLSVYIDDAEYKNKLVRLYLYLKQIFSQYAERAILLRQLEYFICSSLFTRYVIEAGRIVSHVPNLERYVFPFQRITKGCRLLLYGAGDVGQSYYAQLRKLKFCEKIIWQDRNCIEYQNMQLPVQKVDMDVDVDYCVIAVQDENLARSIRSELQLLGMRPDKIIWESPLLNMW